MLNSEASRAAILATYADALRAAGYDVTVSDVVVGRQERGASAREAVVDAGGRLRLTETRMIRPEQSRRVQLQGAQFRWLREQREIVTVMVELDRPEDLPARLGAAETLLVQASAKRK